MFYNCSSLTSIDLSNWNTSNVKYTDFMFYNCLKLETIVTPYRLDHNNKFQEEFKSIANNSLIDMGTLELVNNNTIVKPCYVYTSDPTLLSETFKLSNCITKVLKREY